MTAKFFALLTNIGAAKLANATALGTRLEITQMAVGDGGGTLPTPNPAQTQLVNEQRRAALNMLTIDPINTSQIIAEQVIPEAEGGWWIREIGLLDKDGDLIAIANCAETYKPLMQEGSGRTQTIRVILIVSSTAAVTLKIDPSVVLSTRQYVDKKTDDKAIEVKQYADKLLSEHEKSRNHPDASKTEKGFVKLSSATTSDSEVLAATPKAVKTVAEAAAKALGDHGKDANPHDQYFQIANLLSEIKAQGPAALAETLANLSLGDAAKKGIASNAEMQVGTADKLVSLVGLMSVFGKKTFTTNDYIRFPDVPGGFILQFGTAVTSAAGDVIVTFPVPFPNKILGVYPSQNNSYINGAWASYASKSLASFALSGWTNATTRIAIGIDYLAIGY
ncbi:phage tail protein [Yersinia enterocolitica]|uniref:tail fiber protein n=1 Tax=Yersinia phage vB_YenM_31.17 TaxID=2914028 RepID=UPI001E5576A0|nr:phage tail protein [Yersinia enterocolitica]YP_010664433.1 tail fiber protein [Yersinia phage vB_YenM_31.17]MCE3084216.1 phage tail protein [Yersinia enterocolitica]UKL54261.1 tail fiber protein [Yersinia phage vB_YenM_31.17]